MNSPEHHLDLDTLADVLCGEASTDDTEHAGTCAVCGPALTDLEAAQVPLMAALATLPDPEPPADLGARLEAALARERRAATGTGGPTVLPVALLPRARRRHPAWLPVTAAAAALIAVVGAASVLLPLGGSGSRNSTAGKATTSTGTPAVRRLTTGTDYHKAGPSFNAALPLLLAEAGAAAAAPQQPQPQSGSDQTSALSERLTAADPLARLRDDRALAGCLASLTPPEQPGVPLAVDYAAYEGGPALIVVLPATKPAAVDVYVVGPGCTQANADLRYFVRLPRP